MKYLLLLLIVSLPSFAVETDLSGNIEGQLRHAKNNDEAKEDLFQNWDNENFYLLYGNLNGKVEFERSRVEANWFARYSQSDLYSPADRDPFLATRVFTFPNKLVARDLFKLQHINQNGNHKTESILNKLYYEKDLEKNRFMIGRLYVNYGLGEIFNPINPFNQPTALTSISQIAQGNDGVSVTHFVSDKHSLQFLFLGDKSYDDYEGKITKTIWLRGEYQKSDKLQFDYVLGEDQRLAKLGGQISYQFSEALVFGQVLYQSNNLWDFMLVYDQQVSGKWHLRSEAGYQKLNQFMSPESFERFLPTEYFFSLANIYEAHPLIKLTGTLINDLKSGFTYAIAKSTFDLGHSFEVETFVFSPVSKGDSADNPAQKLVTTDVGISARYFF